MSKHPADITYSKQNQRWSAIRRSPHTHTHTNTHTHTHTQAILICTRMNSVEELDKKNLAHLLTRNTHHHTHTHTITHTHTLSHTHTHTHYHTHTHTHTHTQLHTWT